MTKLESEATDKGGKLSNIVNFNMGAMDNGNDSDGEHGPFLCYSWKIIEGKIQGGHV